MCRWVWSRSLLQGKSPPSSLLIILVLCACSGLEQPWMLLLLTLCFFPSLSRVLIQKSIPFCSVHRNLGGCDQRQPHALLPTGTVMILILVLCFVCLRLTNVLTTMHWSANVGTTLRTVSTACGTLCHHFRERRWVYWEKWWSSPGFCLLITKELHPSPILP